jgi:transposase InsO family protein
MSPSFPGCHRRTIARCPSGFVNGTAQPILHPASQHVVRHKPGDLGTACRSLGMPLSRCRTIVETTTAGGGVAPYLARDGRGSAPEPAGNLTDTPPLDQQRGDLLALYQREVSARQLASCLPPGNHRRPIATLLPSTLPPRCSSRQLHTARTVRARPDSQLAACPATAIVTGCTYPNAASCCPSHASIFEALRRPIAPAQYCSVEYQAELRRHGIRISMSGKRNCYDNAMVEAFFETIKSELVWRTVFYTAPRPSTPSPAISTASTTPSGAIPRSTTSAPRISKEPRHAEEMPLHLGGASPGTPTASPPATCHSGP